MTLDFTLGKYAHLCQTIRQLKCPVMTVQSFLKAGQPKEFLVVLRHDVDRQVNAALRMAELEAELGIRSTYYVRKQPSVFKPEAIRQLHDLGHEVGYHYEILAKSKGNKEKAIYLFEEELKQFREIVPVSTISMHGSPLSPWNNMELWSHYDFQVFDVLGDAVLSVKGKDLLYFTDTGRSWNAKRFNLRDHVSSRTAPRPIHITDDLIGFIEEKPAYPVYISIHPNRWSAHWLGWCMGTVSDYAINQAKRAISFARYQRG